MCIGWFLRIPDMAFQADIPHSLRRKSVIAYVFRPEAVSRGSGIRHEKGKGKMAIRGERRHGIGKNGGVREKASQRHSIFYGSVV